MPVPKLTANFEPSPKPEVLGVVKEEITNPAPAQETVGWQSASGVNIDLTEPPAPWELEDVGFTPSDARRYVDVPSNWILRWINPRLLEQTGWGYWKPVLASDKNVKVKVDSMVAPDGNVRRGGFITGDILSWIYRSWYDKLRQQLAKRTQAQTDAAVRKQEELREEFRRGAYGPYVRLEEARHPTHTMAEGRTMRD